MKIKAIETFLVTLPFRFSFGHSLATRAQSTNLFVRVTLSDGTQGYGEGVPRDYVTGESAEASQMLLEEQFAPLLNGMDVSDVTAVIETLKHTFLDLGLDTHPRGAAWCALELAVLDATSKAHGRTVADCLGPIVQQRIRYGGVIPFGGKNATLGMLLFYRAYGFKTVKVKVGKDLATDVAKVKLARKIMGEDAIVRVDANCAWTVDQALQAAEAFAPYRVASYEQPVDPKDLAGMKKITANVEAQVLADESLCTIAQAEMLAREKICSAFNVRISKVGGLLAAQRMVDIAREHGIKCHLGAQVGESGILSAAARTFAVVNPRFENYEGSMNAFLLRKDLTAENLTVGPGGFGDLSYRCRQEKGFRFSIGEGTLESWAQPATPQASSSQTSSSQSVLEEAVIEEAPAINQEIFAGKPN